MVANVYGRGNYLAYQASRPLPPAVRDHVAPLMVQSWTGEQRARIRGILLTLLAGYPQGTDLLGTPEMRVVAMIDRQENAE